jgi:NAD(P)-dependent dehydrogenase (short-subunit alcohol dehydrogenase family)
MPGSLLDRLRGRALIYPHGHALQRSNLVGLDLVDAAAADNEALDARSLAGRHAGWAITDVRLMITHRSKAPRPNSFAATAFQSHETAKAAIGAAKRLSEMRRMRRIGAAAALSGKLEAEMRGQTMTLRLNGKSALITGAARGIGTAFAKAFVGEGATVAIGDIDHPRAAATAAAIGKGAYAVPLDVTDEASIDAAVAEVEATAGGLDILVNSAAVFDLAPLVEVTRESFDRLFRINVAGTLFMMKAAARQMIAQGRGGKIINMASQAGRRGEPLVAVYCATKAAVISLTQSAGLDLIRHRINVNAISPGVVEGEHWEQVDALFARYKNRPIGEKKRLVGAGVPYGRMGVAEDLTGMAVFLASAEADYIVAQTYNVDGGQWMS